MMKSRRRTAARLFAAAAVLAMGLQQGCGRENPESVTEKGNSQKHKVVLIAKSTTSAFWKSVQSGANAASTEYNMDFLFEGPANEEDYETQNKMIEQAVEDGAEAIVLSAVDYYANAQAIEEAAGKGVQTVVIDSDVSSNLVQCRIGTDNYVAGSMAGEAVLAAEDETLHIGIVNFDKNSENGQEREEGFRDTVQKDSRAVIVDTINVISSTQEAKEGTEEMLKRHPQINVIVTFNEWTSLGVGYAIRELKLGDSTTVVAFDSNVVSVGMLETGEVDALIVQNPYAMGYLAIESAYNLLEGYSLEADTVYTDTMLVTRENMFDDECQRALFAFE